MDNIKKSNSKYIHLICPICGNKMKTSSNSIVCSNNHCYDVSKSGYINFLHNINTKYYSKELFKNRRFVLESNFYKPVIDKIDSLVDKYIHVSIPSLLDVGCGEGYYCDMVYKNRLCSKIAFDISKEAVLLASKRTADILWLVSDLNNIPIENNCIDVVLNILTPANYKEFSRILKKDGIVIKIIPGSNYLIQFRELVNGKVNKDYTNNKVKEYFAKHLQLIETQTISYELNLTHKEVLAFSKMTPMLRNIDIADEDISKIKNITIELDLLVGKIK